MRIVQHLAFLKAYTVPKYTFFSYSDKLVPGKMGMALVEGYDSMGIAMSKPNYRFEPVPPPPPTNKTKKEVFKQMDILGFLYIYKPWVFIPVVASRASLEADLKAICDGTKTKEEVLAAQIAIYRQIFTLSLASAKKLDAATQRFLEVRIFWHLFT